MAVSCLSYFLVTDDLNDRFREKQTFGVMLLISRRRAAALAPEPAIGVISSGGAANDGDLNRSMQHFILDRQDGVIAMKRKYKRIGFSVDNDGLLGHSGLLLGLLPVVKR